MMINYSFSFKKYFHLFFLLLFSVIGAQKKFTVVLDAGHGGSDHGANRYYSEVGTLREKDVTLSVVLKVGRMLEKNKDFKIIYTRKIDEYHRLPNVLLWQTEVKQIFLSLFTAMPARKQALTALKRLYRDRTRIKPILRWQKLRTT